MKRVVNAVVMALAVFTWFCSSAAANDGEMKELNFGIISTESTANLKKGFEPFLQELEKKTRYESKCLFCPRLCRCY